MKKTVVAILIFFSCDVALPQSREALDFLEGHTDFREVRTMFSDWSRAQALRLLDLRRAGIDKLSTAQDWAERKRLFRERFVRSLGGFPERTPLNARVTGSLERSGIRIEKVIFESQPGFYVTANLYLPLTGQGPYPAILFPLGHEEGAKAHLVWQQLLITFAQRGFVTLAWDTLGQGERVQLFDPDLGESKAIRSTTEHTILGVQCLLTGDTLSRYTIWDGIRALDYLLSRPEVDPKRVGCTGNSGGGTHTAYLSALDDRIQVAAPSCFLTTWGRLLKTIGPQDAEQCVPPSIFEDLDHADFVHAFAPKPYLILSAIRDFFSITGARETYREAGKSYAAFAAADKLAMVEADDGHGYSKPRREAAYRWFSRWLQGSENNAPEPDVLFATPEELYCTPTGQVATSLGGETVSSLNLKRAQQFQRPPQPALDSVRRLIALREPDGSPSVTGFGTAAIPGGRLEKLVYESEEGIRVPAVMFRPESSKTKHPAAIIVHGQGKSAAGVEARQLAARGWIVLAIDARGFGETRHLPDNYGSDWPRYFGDYESAMTLLLAGQTTVGGRVVDIKQGINLLASRDDVDREKIAGVGIAGGCIPLLHAAALDARIRRVALDGMLLSYMSVVQRQINRGIFEDVIPGVLKAYDLPGLARLLNPRPVWVVDAQDPTGTRIEKQAVRHDYDSQNVTVSHRRPGEEGVTPYAEITKDW